MKKGSKKGKRNPMYGKHHTEETKKKMTKSLLGHPVSRATRKKISRTMKAKAKKLSEKEIRELCEARKRFFASPAGIKIRKKLSEALTGRQVPEKTKEKIRGERNPAWRGGISFDPYSPAFNGAFKRKIRARDNHTCQLCGRGEEESLERNWGKLIIHHIDYNKLNTTEENCIALCRSCNGKVNRNREYWTKYFLQMLLLSA